MIDQAHIENFKCLKNVTVDLGRLSVFVGPNGSGKSSVLQGMQLLSRAAAIHQPNPEDAGERFASMFSGPRSPSRFTAPQRPVTLKLETRSDTDDKLTLEVSLPESGVKNGTTSSNTRLTLDGAGGRLITESDTDSATLLKNLSDARMRQFDSSVYLQLDARRMSRISVSQEARPHMSTTGAQLASVLAWMKGAAEEELNLITRDLASIVPGVRRIRTFREVVKHPDVDTLEINGQEVFRTTEKVVMGDRFEIEFEDRLSIPSDLLSEGTILALGLLTKLHEPNPPTVILLDDIDRGLHIEAQASLMKVLRALLAARPDLQIACTTHSPYLVSLFDPSEVRVFALDTGRHTRVQPLTAHPDFDRWKFGAQTGELWAALGHSWVAESAQAH